MNPQHQVLLSRNCSSTVSLLPHNSSASINPTTASSNISFGSSSALNFNQQRPLSLPKGRPSKPSQLIPNETENRPSSLRPKSSVGFWSCQGLSRPLLVLMF
ncbi:hypothetical protein EV2_022576 [Malus domestica]